MNNKTILAITFLLAGTLFTSTMAMAPAYAGGDDDDDDHKDGDRYDKGGDGNKQKVEDESAGSIADCDDNEFERATQNCIATAATDDSVVINGRDGDDDDDDNGDNGNGDGEEINICHATSAGFFVELTIDVDNPGHDDHEDDIIPAPAEGCPDTVEE